MKLTKDNLKKIIQEELQQMIDEGELEEGPMDMVKNIATQQAGNAKQKLGQQLAAARQQPSTDSQLVVKSIQTKVQAIQQQIAALQAELQKLTG